MEMFKKIANFLKYTPFHPQWHIFKEKNKILLEHTKNLSGIVLDIGCSDMYLKEYISKNSKYIGLDYLTTASKLYTTSPNIYADGQSLPIKSNSISSVVILEVLEHISNPLICINECYRVLEHGGKCIISTPFLYPIHDAPFDFTRWSKFGLNKILEESGFKIKKISPLGKIPQSSAIIFNLGLAKSCINFYNAKSPIGLIFIPFYLLLIPIINIMGWLLGLIECDKDFMPYGYFFICVKE